MKRIFSIVSEFDWGKITLIGLVQKWTILIVDSLSNFVKNLNAEPQTLNAQLRSKGCCCFLQDGRVRVGMPGCDRVPCGPVLLRHTRHLSHRGAQEGPDRHPVRHTLRRQVHYKNI